MKEDFIQFIRDREADGVPFGEDHLERHFKYIPDFFLARLENLEEGCDPNAVGIPEEYPVVPFGTKAAFGGLTIPRADLPEIIAHFDSVLQEFDLELDGPFTDPPVRA